MKRTLTILAILAVLTFGGCNRKAIDTTVKAETVAQVAQRVEATKATSHTCGAITKAGKPCTRKVGNGDGTDTAVEAKCFQHRD